MNFLIAGSIQFIFSSHSQFMACLLYSPNLAPCGFYFLESSLLYVEVSKGGKIKIGEAHEHMNEFVEKRAPSSGNLVQGTKLNGVTLTSIFSMKSFIVSVQSGYLIDTSCKKSPKERSKGRRRASKVTSPHQHAHHKKFH